jgi:putative ABC transport system permease protein
VASITLVAYLPAGLRVVVGESAAQLTARADATPLLVGAKGSPLELVLSSLYFDADPPAPTSAAAAERVRDSGLARAIPLYVRFSVRDVPIVATSIDYFELRGLRPAAGRLMAVLGECVLGAVAAEALGVGVGDAVVSSPESVFDLAGVYPLKMSVVGVLEPTHTPDDRAVFVDVKTAWVIEGLGHGHQDLSRPEAAAGVLDREGDRITANASLQQYNEITPANIDSFHFHGDPSAYPLSAVLVVPQSDKAEVILMGRYESADGLEQIVRPRRVMDRLLATVFTVREFVVGAMLLVALATAATAALVFLLSIRLRRSEIATMHRIGGSRRRVGAVLASEIVVVVAASALLAAVLTWLTSRFGEALIRRLLLS